MTAATDKRLEERARRFAAVYRGKGTGVQAARAVGYEGDARTLAVTAHRLAKDPRVLAEIDRIQGEAIKARAAGADVVDADGQILEVAAPALPRLRAQHARFLEAWIECGSYAEAAARADYSGGAAALRRKGSDLAKRPDIAAHLAAARRRIEANAIADRNELEALLTAIARGDQSERTRDRIAAIRELAKIQGHAGPGLGSFRSPSLPAIPESSSGAAVFIWRGNGRGPAPDEV